MNRNDVAVEDDSSDKEPVRRIKKKEGPVSKNSKDRMEHVNNTTKMRKISATAEICQKAKAEAKQTKKNKM